jgi:hypothetical protein
MRLSFAGPKDSIKFSFGSAATAAARGSFNCCENTVGRASVRDVETLRVLLIEALGAIPKRHRPEVTSFSGDKVCRNCSKQSTFCTGFGRFYPASHRALDPLFSWPNRARSRRISARNFEYARAGVLNSRRALSGMKPRVRSMTFSRAYRTSISKRNFVHLHT